MYIEVKQDFVNSESKDKLIVVALIVSPWDFY